ncbi:hypothetical protein FOZ62_015407, partial [Perkinsus olseni]
HVIIRGDEDAADKMMGGKKEAYLFWGLGREPPRRPPSRTDGYKIIVPHLEDVAATAQTYEDRRPRVAILLQDLIPHKVVNESRDALVLDIKLPHHQLWTRVASIYLSGDIAPRCTL